MKPLRLSLRAQRLPAAGRKQSHVSLSHGIATSAVSGLATTRPKQLSTLFRRTFLWASSTLFLAGCTLKDWLPAGKTPETLEIADTVYFVNSVIKFLGAFAGLVAFFVMIAGYQYLMSAGSEEGVTRAKDTIRYSAVGMLFLVGGYGLVRLVIALLAPTAAPNIFKVP